jgi:hypothetical protein
MIVDGCDRDVDLGGPVRLVAVWWALHELELLHQVPPEGVRVLKFGSS